MRTIPLSCSFLALGWLVLSGCTDIQKCKVGTEGCVCNSSEACETGLMCWKDTSSAGAASSDDRGVCLAEICEDTCDEPGNSCDDGSENSEYALCACGTDCSDCGPRAAALCQPSLTQTTCTDTCQHADDTVCDDGGDGSKTSSCDWGTDCTDCGPRTGTPP